MIQPNLGKEAGKSEFLNLLFSLIYVNFKSSLKLEPLYKTTTNAPYWFNQWVMLKVISGIYESLDQTNCETVAFKLTRLQTEKNIGLLELGRIDLLNNSEDLLTLNEIHELADNICNTTGKSRFILLLDDAGHAFSTDQQKDFLSFFDKSSQKKFHRKQLSIQG